MTRDASSKPLAGTRVLVVAGDDDEREMLAHVLELGGAEVLTAATAEAARDAAGGRARLDALVLDVPPPEVDGSRLAAELRRLAERDGARVRAVALTGRAPASRDGFDACLVKPVGLAELADAVVG